MAGSQTQPLKGIFHPNNTAPRHVATVPTHKKGYFEIKNSGPPTTFCRTSKKDFAPNYFQLFSAEADPKEAGDKISDIFFGRHFI